MTEGTPAEQAQKLKEEYEKKLAEINARSLENPENNSESEPIPSEHEAISRVTEDKIKEEVPNFVASSHTPHDSNDIPPESQAKIQDCLNILLVNPSAGIKKARGLNDSDLDNFHKVASSDPFYQEMVKRGKILELK